MEALISLEKSKVRLRFLVLSVFLFWGLLSASVWYYITSVPRAPIPSLSSFPLAERIHSLTLENSEEKNTRSSTVDRRNRDALEAYKHWEISFYQNQRHRGNSNSQTPSSSSSSSSPLLPFLPPVLLGYTLQLIPLCPQAESVASAVYATLAKKAKDLRVSGRSFLPSRPKLYGSIFASERTISRSQEKEERDEKAKDGDKKEHDKEDKDDEKVKETGQKEREGEKETEDKEFVTDLNLLFSSSTSSSDDYTPQVSLSLLRVVLLPPPSSSSSCSPSSLAIQDEDKDELTYKIFFFSSSYSSRQDPHSKDSENNEESSSSSPLPTSPHTLPHITLHADSSITVVLSDTSSSLLDMTRQALLRLLQDTFFRSLPSQTSSFLPFSSQYDLTFWLAGDTSPSSSSLQRKKNEHGSFQRLTWNFEEDVYAPYLQDFFSGLSLMYDFPQIQSQVISLSGIKSLLKRPPSRSNEFSSFSSSSSSWVLDLASQHKLHAVASTWEPEQILTELTNAPSPEINFAIYRSPVSIIFKGRGEGKKREEEKEEVDHPVDSGERDFSSDDTEDEEEKKPDDERKKQTAKRNITGIAISGWGSLIVIPPSSLSSSGSSSVVEIPPREMRDVCGVLIAQVRSFFSLPSTLVDYFHSRRIVKDKNDEEEVISENESQETPHEDFSSTIIRNEARKKVLLQSSSVPLNVEKTNKKQQNKEAEEEETATNSVVMIWRRIRDEKDYIGGEEETEEKAVVVVAEHSPTGVGLWELWRLALSVYVHLVQLAVTNIRSLQRILENQTELAVPPHVGEALERALTLVDCSVEALQRRLCSQMPQDVLHSLFLTRGDVPHLSSSSHGDKRDMKEERNTEKPRSLLESPSLSSAQYLALSLGLARAAYRDSLEALHDESVTGQSHFKFEFKVAIYLPIVVPFFLPVLIGFLKVHKMNQVLKRATAALRSTLGHTAL